VCRGEVVDALLCLAIRVGMLHNPMGRFTTSLAREGSFPAWVPLKFRCSVNLLTDFTAQYQLRVPMVEASGPHVSEVQVGSICANVVTFPLLLVT